MLSEQYTQLLTSYIDGELDQRQRKAVERLLEELPEARSLLAKLEGDSRELKEVPSHKAPETLPEMVMETLSDSVQRVAKPLSRPGSSARGWAVPPWLGLSVAACVLLTVTVGTFLMVRVLVGQRNPDGAVADNKPVPMPKQPENLVVAPVEQAPPPQLDTFVAALVGAAAGKFAEPVTAKDIGLRLPLTELGQSALKQRLADEIDKHTGLWLDMPVPSTAKGVNDLIGIFRKNEIKLAIDSSIKGGKPVEGKKYLLYTENLKPQELTKILEQLAKADPSTWSAEPVVVQGMTKKEYEKLGSLMRVDWKDVTPSKYGGKMIDLPIAVEGEPDPKSKVGRLAMAPKPYAVLLPCEGSAPLVDLQGFVKERSGQTRGAVQVVLVIHLTKAL